MDTLNKMIAILVGLLISSILIGNKWDGTKL